MIPGIYYAAGTGTARSVNNVKNTNTTTTTTTTTATTTTTSWWLLLLQEFDPTGWWWWRKGTWNNINIYHLQHLTHALGLGLPSSSRVGCNVGWRFVCCFQNTVCCCCCCFSHSAYWLPTRKNYFTRWPIPLVVCWTGDVCCVCESPLSYIIII